MIQDIIIPFIAIGLAEIGDKTQLAVLCLAGKTKQYFRLFLGVLAAFIIIDGLAVIIGAKITNYLPETYIKIFSGTLFIIFGLVMLLKKEEKETTCSLKNPFLSSFFLILISEMGDKTQITSGLFATQMNPYFVFIGVILALSLISIITIYCAKIICNKVNQKTITKVAGIVFIVLGILAFL